MLWKKEEVEYLIENYPKNIPLVGISQKINKTLRAIHHKAAREGLSRKRFPSDKPSKRIPRKIIDKRYYLKNREKIYQNKKKRMAGYKLEMIKLLGGKCSQCGYHKCVSALEFHHKEGNKEDNITGLLSSKSKQQILKEVKKCILLCANCHRELHYGDHS